MGRAWCDGTGVVRWDGRGAAGPAHAVPNKDTAGAVSLPRKRIGVESAAIPMPETNWRGICRPYPGTGTAKPNIRIG